MSTAGPPNVSSAQNPLPASSTASKWQEACERCKARLSQEDAAVILTTPSYQHLITAMGGMEQAYKDKKSAKILKHLAPALESIRSFGGIINTAIPANPDVAALMWGGIRLVLDLLLRSSMAIEKITAGFSEITKALSRFEEYQTFFTSAPRLNEALVDLYELVFGFFIESIKLFRRHPI
ncbi:unnamed protein product, partial [Clonostachys rosea f. rosea IK726]